MSDAEQIFIATEEEVEQKARKASKKVEQTINLLDETQQRAAAAYAAYKEAERQLEEAYKEQERDAERIYNEAVDQARRVCEESTTQALRTYTEAEQKAREARNEAVGQTWAVFTKVRK